MAKRAVYFVVHFLENIPMILSVSISMIATKLFIAKIVQNLIN